MHHHPGFINKHTAVAILALAVGCFLAGYYVGQMTERDRYVMPASDSSSAQVNY